MEIRKVQRSGNTNYLYLPSDWCKRHNITRGSSLVVERTAEGALLLKSETTENQRQDLHVVLDVTDPRVVSKFVVASSLLPVNSFNIRLRDKVPQLEILEQRKLLGGVEMVEFGGKTISCEHLVMAQDPLALLRTMIRKLTHLLHLLQEEHDEHLLERYEEEIDRSNVLITKSAMSALLHRPSGNLRAIELFYLAILSKNLECFADELHQLKKQKHTLKACTALMRHLLKTLDILNCKTAGDFAQQAVLLIERIAKRQHTELLQMSLHQCADAVVDWALTKELDCYATE